ncbi:MAG: multiheme c-type cytochrome, partial [Geminicoccaceae bacterium]
MNAGPSIPNYVGSESCAECHQGITRAWEQSHHALAWTLPDKTTVLGNFDDAMFQHEGMTARFMSDEQNFHVETEGAGGSQTRFQVEGVVGIAPLQQYLVATEAGRFQALDVAWDIGRARWYHLYPDHDLKPGDGLHWTGPYKTWNARCAECHATGFEKNYDPRTHRFKSTQAEIGVGCEACHGPGEAHVAWAEGREID